MLEAIVPLWEKLIVSAMGGWSFFRAGMDRKNENYCTASLRV